MTRLVLQRSLREPGHIVNLGSVAGRWAYPNGATYVTVEVRRARLHARAARGPARPRHPRHHRRLRSRRDRVLDRPLPRRRGARRRPSTRERGRCRPTTSPTAILFAVTRPPHMVVDEMRADVDRPVERRPHPPQHLNGTMLTILEGSTFCISDERGDMAGASGGLFAQDTRRLSRFVLTINGAAPAAALVGPGRVLLGRVLPPQPARRPAAGRALDRAHALRRRVDAGADRRSATSRWSRCASTSALELGSRLRRHLRGQGARLHARRPRAREAAAAAGAGRVARATARSASPTAATARRCCSRCRAAQSGSGATWDGRAREPRAAGSSCVEVLVGTASRRAARPADASATSSRTSATRSPRGSCACRR